MLNQAHLPHVDKTLVADKKSAGPHHQRMGQHTHGKGSGCQNEVAQTCLSNPLWCARPAVFGDRAWQLPFHHTIIYN
jgi:hypothetical protein